MSLCASGLLLCGLIHCQNKIPKGSKPKQRGGKCPPPPKIKTIEGLIFWGWNLKNIWVIIFSRFTCILPMECILIKENLPLKINLWQLLYPETFFWEAIDFLIVSPALYDNKLLMLQSYTLSSWWLHTIEQAVCNYSTWQESAPWVIITTIFS